MPVYEFQCDDCGQVFEALLRFSQADEKQSCPGCGGQNTHRLLSRIAAPSFSGGSGASVSGSCGGGGGFT